MTSAETRFERGEFVNEPFTDFSKPDNRAAMELALAQVARELGREYPIRIAGEKIVTQEKIRSTNPVQPDQVVGVFQKRTPETAHRAVEAAEAFHVSNLYCCESTKAIGCLVSLRPCVLAPLRYVFRSR